MCLYALRLNLSYRRIVKRGHSKEKHKYIYICIPTSSNKISCICLFTFDTFFEKNNCTKAMR